MAAVLAVVVALAAPFTAAAQDSAVIPLLHQKGRVIPNTIRVSVGGGASVPVLFDTGSSGLRILATALGPDVRRTSQRVEDSYGDGTVVEGFVGYAKVRFPDAQPPLPVQEVAIHVVERVTCKPDRPHCPGLGKLDQGILGVDYEPDGALFNVLAQLPGPLGAGMVVDVRDDQRPHVRVGLSARDRSSFRFADLRPAKKAMTGQPGWNTRSLTACYAVDDRPAGCQPVTFDTGAAAMHFTFNDAPSRLARDDRVVPGHRVSIRVHDLVDLTELTGPGAPVHLSPRPRSNSGEAFFRRFAVAFDAVQGRIGFLH